MTREEIHCSTSWVTSVFCYRRLTDAVVHTTTFITPLDMLYPNPTLTVSTKHWNLYESERNVLFNDALNTFYLRLYGVRHMVKDHSDSEERKPAAAT